MNSVKFHNLSNSQAGLVHTFIILCSHFSFLQYFNMESESTKKLF